jgi:hypothetical protein
MYAERFVPVTSRKVVHMKGGGERETLTKDVTDWSHNQLILLLRKDSVDVVAQQIRLDNPPAFASVDRSRGKPITEAVRRVEITFGMALKPQALNVLMGELRRAIGQSTSVKTGRLSDMANWTFLHVSKGVSRPISGALMGGSGIPMGPGDFVVLRPTGVPHATVVNRKVRNGSRSMTLRRTRQKSERPTKANQGIGFLAFAARRAKRHSLFRGFHVVVSFTRRIVAGELSRRQGTGTIVIRPNVGRSGRRR